MKKITSSYFTSSNVSYLGLIEKIVSLKQGNLGYFHQLTKRPLLFLCNVSKDFLHGAFTCRSSTYTMISPWQLTNDAKPGVKFTINVTLKK